MEEEIIIEKKYSIPYEMFGDAFRTFQKKFVYPKSYAMIVVLLIAAILNVINITIGKGTSLGYVLILVCLALAFINWYNPRKLRRNLMESIKGIENDVYRLKLMPDKLVIGTVVEPENGEEKPKEEYEEVFDDTVQSEEIEDSVIYLTRSVYVVDKSEYMIIYLKRVMFYVIPKKDFSEEEMTIMQIHFQKQLGKNYRKNEK